MTKKKKRGRPKKIDVKSTPKKEHWKTRQKRERESAKLQIETPEPKKDDLFEIFEPVSIGKQYAKTARIAEKLEKTLKILKPRQAFRIKKEETSNAFVRQYLNDKYPNRDYRVSSYQKNDGVEFFIVTYVQETKPSYPQEIKNRKSR